MSDHKQGENKASSVDCAVRFKLSREQESKKPTDNDFTQQRLKAWQPLLTPLYVITSFAIIGVLFLIIGGVCIDASNKVLSSRSCCCILTGHHVTGG